MSIADPTAELAPGKYLPCPACGASTFTRFDVKKHDEWHEEERKRIQRFEGLMARLEGFLDAAEGVDPDDPDAQPVPFAEWMGGVDEAIEELRKASKPTAAPIALARGEWTAGDDLPDADPGRGDAHDGYPAGFDDPDALTDPAPAALVEVAFADPKPDLDEDDEAIDWARR